MARRSSALEKELVQEIRATPREHLPNLLRIVQSFRDSVTLKPAAECIRQGLKEALAGETYPISELWEDLDGDGAK